MKSVNTLVVGAGQSGLSLSYYLTQRGIDHLVLDKGQAGEEWRSRRWDAFHLITPNHMTQMPGFPYSGDNPHGFDSRDELVKFFEDYAKSFKAPVVGNTQVTSVTKKGADFLVKTDQEDYSTKNVVIAIGSFHQPQIPDFSKDIQKEIKQLHSSEYKNSKQLPEGAVLIVGGGNSGIQIAKDLNTQGKKVFLSIGKQRIVPRNYRGKDFMEWAEVLGILDRKTEEASEEVKNTVPPLLFGSEETVNLRKLAKGGVQLLGRLNQVTGETASFNDDLVENIEKGEAALAGFKATVNKYILEHNLDIPQDIIPEEVVIQNNDGSPITSGMTQNKINLKEAGIKTIIWATGFKDDWSFLEAKTLNERGQPIHNAGVSKIPGLYFLGLRWQTKYKSFLLCGVAEDAKYIAEQIK